MRSRPLVLRAYSCVQGTCPACMPDGIPAWLVDWLPSICLQAVKPGMFEYQAESLYLHTIYGGGSCRGPHYTPILASGPNAGAVLGALVCGPAVAGNWPPIRVLIAAALSQRADLLKHAVTSLPRHLQPSFTTATPAPPTAGRCRRATCCWRTRAPSSTGGCWARLRLPGAMLQHLLQFSRRRCLLTPC